MPIGLGLDWACSATLVVLCELHLDVWCLINVDVDVDVTVVVVGCAGHKGAVRLVASRVVGRLRRGCGP